MPTLPKLILYNLWANQSWLEHIATKYSDDEYLRKMISHILLGEQAWFQRISAQPVDKDVFRLLNNEQLRALWKTHEKLYEEVLAGDLERVIAYTRFNGDQFQSSISDILMHLVTHGSHHRGQLATHASKMKYESLNTDYINYTRLNLK